MIKLGLLDKKLLLELDKNSRQSFSSIARKLKTSQQVIQYKVNRLVDLGVITSFVTVFSTLSLGLPLVGKIYLQLGGISTEKEKEIFSYLLNNSHTNWVAKTLGKFDLFCAVMVDNLQTFASFKNNFFEKYGHFVKESEISFIELAYTLPRSFLLSRKSSLNRPLAIKETSMVSLTSKEKKLLKLLANNSRITSLELAKSLDMNVKTVISKIKSFEKKNVIQGYRININRKKLGLSYFKVFIKLNSQDPKEVDLLKKYCLFQDRLVHLIQNIGKYELELEIEIDNSENLYQFIKELRNSYPDVIETVESVEILKELKLSWLPKKF